MRDFFDGKFSVHFIGIGGIGMSALALYLNNLGFSVSGSDKSENEMTRRLIGSGITVYRGHSENNARGKEVVVYSSAVSPQNPELAAARSCGAAIYSRAEVLSLISRRYALTIGVCGAHGKTTTTALIAHILHAAEKRFTAFIGGEDVTFSNTANFGNDIFLAEICEYKKNIDLFTMNTAVMLNVDDDHLDSYDGFDDLICSFEQFYIRANKRVVFAEDTILSTFAGDKITFGTNAGDYRAKNVRALKNRIKLVVACDGNNFFRAKVALTGKHNALNVLAAVAVARELKIGKKTIKKGLKSFKGIKRRDEYLGKINGAKVFADYAHHPEELSRSLEKYTKISKGRAFFVFQPHTYSRTKLLFDEFVKTFENQKKLYIFKEYAAREVFDESGCAKKLADALPQAEYFSEAEDLIESLKKNLKSRDLVVVLGAGDLYDMIKRYLQK